TQLIYTAPVPVQSDPGIRYREVTFPSCEDGVALKGWLIPGVLPSGALTTQRTIIVVHGNRQNRTDPGGLSAEPPGGSCPPRFRHLGLRYAREWRITVSAAITGLL